MVLPLLFFATVVVVCFLLLGIFANLRKRLRLRHDSTLQGLQNSFDRNREQLEFREMNLRKYDFQKYNLSEALVPQYSIKP
ncbi:MAG: hypothetical protein CMC08_05230 [Flavobacteriaceae bacterium]|nr:hypothetical protein [Flavobacteriaceae bacterium]